MTDAEYEWIDAQDAVEDLSDAIIEDTFHCDLCNASLVCGGNDDVVIDGPNVGDPHSKLGGQLKLCLSCAGKVRDAYRDVLTQVGICEHGCNDDEYCHSCNQEYKRARARFEAELFGDDDR